MAVILINPNSTEAMTRSGVAAARRQVPSLTFEGWTSHAAPAAIQGPEDGAAAVPPLLELVAKADAGGAEAIVIMCFDDTGLAEARRLARCPVIGIGQAAYTMAALIGDRFSVVTTLAVSIPVIEQNIHDHGFASRVVEVTASGVPVLDLEFRPDEAVGTVTRAVYAAAAKGPDIVVLGCSGMVNVVDRIREETGLRIVDGVTAAAQLVHAQLAYLHRLPGLAPAG